MLSDLAERAERRILLLRHGRQLRLRRGALRRFAAHGRAGDPHPLGKHAPPSQLHGRGALRRLFPPALRQCHSRCQNKINGCRPKASRRRPRTSFASNWKRPMPLSSTASTNSLPATARNCAPGFPPRTATGPSTARRRATAGKAWTSFPTRKMTALCSSRSPGRCCSPIRRCTRSCLCWASCRAGSLARFLA
mgnify:CR=1 FL=1